MTSTAAVARFRARRKEAGIPDRDRLKQKDYKRDHKRAKAQEDRPFIGCDGEGCGTDEHGRQLYTLFRMGERELFADGRHLRTEELLQFICDQPRGSILVGFAFGYDVTMILRDLPESQQRRLFEPKTFGEGKSPFVWYKDFNIDYLPRQYLKVSRVKIERGQDGAERRIPIKGSQRIIYETFGFFQKSFLKVIEEFEVGTLAQREEIRIEKDRRSSFSSITDRERQYCALECEFLAELMEKLRGYCHAAGIVPRTWSGAGKLAAALHKLHETPKGAEIRDLVPREVHDLANMAYYGGRFEITRVGKIKEKVYEYDIRSAYPDAMRRLPCLVHGEWRSSDAKEIREVAANVGGRYGTDPIFVAGCTFKPANKKGPVPPLGGLPVRSKEGHLYWPSQGGGVYWSCEIASAERLGYAITYKDGWIYRKRCDCRVFDWVDRLYEYRKSIGGSGPGYPIKLGINSLYGKLAQRKGNGSYNNMIWAGLITAMTRTKLNDAIALNPGGIVMVATDAVYSLDRLPLPCGDTLGDWEAVELPGLFIVQPGLYWCPARRKKKSRGLSGKFFEQVNQATGNQMTEDFELAWQEYSETAPLVPRGKKAVQDTVVDFMIGRGGIRLITPKGDVHSEAADIVDRFKDLIPDKARRKALAIRDRRERILKLAQLLAGKSFFAKAQGLSPDYMREALQEDGWFVETISQGDDMEDLHDLLFNIRQGNVDAIIHPRERYESKEQDFPQVEVPVPGFIGLKLAVSRGKPQTAGCWVQDKRVISFDYRNKRQGHHWQGNAIVLKIKPGHPGLMSLPHRDFLKAGGQESWEMARLMLEEQPDYIDLGIPFKD